MTTCGGAKRIKNLMKEDHHRVYARPWALGLDHYEFMIKQGLKPNHKLLEVGCGSGRGGIHFIDYLDKDNYTGVDGAPESVNAFVSYEVVLNKLTHKNPKIWVQNVVTEPLALDEKFDFIFSYSVWNHIARTTKNVKEILNDLAVKHLKDDGRMVISHCDPKRIASDKGDIVLVDDCKTESVLVENNHTRWTTWHKKKV